MKNTFKMKQEENKNNNCCICSKHINGYGNNAQPLKRGICCDECNFLVIEERLKERDKIVHFQCLACGHHFHDTQDEPYCPVCPENTRLRILEEEE